ncbi:hypothetical protein EDB86DRAFT_3084018 [Lactarius hatsudake]|nr:hypothetical protein EDB86DRAFT_3084018 [Lactarius hatsudake]
MTPELMLSSLAWLRCAAQDKRPVFVLRISLVSFTRGDVKLWTEFDRILQLDADTNDVARAHRASPWTDAWACTRTLGAGQVGADGAGTDVRMCVRMETNVIPPHDDGTRTTLALLQTFHARKRFLLSRLATVLPPASTVSDAQLTTRDLLALALGSLSSLDVRFVEMLAEVYAGGARASVHRGWRNLLGGLVGAAVGGPGAASES